MANEERKLTTESNIQACLLRSVVSKYICLLLFILIFKLLSFHSYIIRNCINVNTPQKLLSRVGIMNNVAWTPNCCCYGKSRVTNLCVIYDLHVDANNTKPFSVAMKTQQWVQIALLWTNKIFPSDVKRLNELRPTWELLLIFVIF